MVTHISIKVNGPKPYLKTSCLGPGLAWTCRLSYPTRRRSEPLSESPVCIWFQASALPATKMRRTHGNLRPSRSRVLWKTCLCVISKSDFVDFPDILKNRICLQHILNKIPLRKQTTFSKIFGRDNHVLMFLRFVFIWNESISLCASKKLWHTDTRRWALPHQSIRGKIGRI